MSPKRTRSYHYVRVYDTLNFQVKFSGQKVTIIPAFKDEGKERDRDFIQWDTVSLMSLLGVYVIITYYKSAEKSLSYRHKITNQRFDYEYIKEELNNILFYHSDALHWNLAQIEKVGEIAKKALTHTKKFQEYLVLRCTQKSQPEKELTNSSKRKRFL